MRFSATPALSPGRHARMTTSISVPMMTKIASPMASGAKIGAPLSQAAPTTAVTAPMMMAKASRCTTPRRSPRFHASEKPNGAAKQAVSKQRAAGQIEEGRADGDLLAGQLLERERVEGAEQHGRAGGRQKQIVDDERALARDRREQSALLEHRRAPGEEDERTANEHRENREDENAATRIVGEGVDGGEHARAHEKGAEQRKGEGEDGEKDRPDFQRVALLHHRDRMDEGRAGEPRHEGGVLDRIPEPEAAPAERVIGPEGAGGDAEREEAPGDERERTDEARPGRVDAALDQRRGGERIDDREADIAEIEQRRMDREAGVLQNRIEVASLERRRREPLERVRGQENEGEEGEADQALNGERVGAQASRGSARPNRATSAPKIARMRTHSSIEPSWFPHTPEIL